MFSGSSHTNNVRLYDVMAHGCVPVIVSDDFQPPLDTLLPWKELAIFLPTSSIPRPIWKSRVLRSVQAWSFQQPAFFWVVGGLRERIAGKSEEVPPQLGL